MISTMPMRSLAHPKISGFMQPRRQSFDEQVNNSAPVSTKNEQTPLNCDLLIVDEFSIVDCILMHHLLKAVPLHATFVMVGDVDQLPSVGAGNVLKDIIASGAVPVVELNEILRQAQQSSIIVNAHKINNGIIPSFRTSEHHLDDFYFIERDDPDEAIQVLIVHKATSIQQAFRWKLAFSVFTTEYFSDMPCSVI
jgi:ATP-dependent exoDNAse (exonuclease V) alpha subunit